MKSELKSGTMGCSAILGVLACETRVRSTHFHSQFALVVGQTFDIQLYNDFEVSGADAALVAGDREIGTVEP